jgi:hypothetical protein
MSTKSTRNGVNSAVPRRGVYIQLTPRSAAGTAPRMLIPGRAVEFQASPAEAAPERGQHPRWADCTTSISGHPMKAP